MGWTQRGSLYYNRTSWSDLMLLSHSNDSTKNWWLRLHAFLTVYSCIKGCGTFTSQGTDSTKKKNPQQQPACRLSCYRATWKLSPFAKTWQAVTKRWHPRPPDMLDERLLGCTILRYSLLNSHAFFNLFVINLTVWRLWHTVCSLWMSCYYRNDHVFEWVR